MTKLRKSLLTVFAAVIFVAGILAAVLLPKSVGISYADSILEITGENESEYLDITEETDDEGKTFRILNGFKSSAELPSKINLVIPEGVTNVAKDAFKDCKQLIRVEIPMTLKVVDENAFANCTGIVEVCTKSPDVPVPEEGQTDGFGGLYKYALHVYNYYVDSTSTLEVDGDYIFCATATDSYAIYYLVGYLGEETVVNLPGDYKTHGYNIYQYAFMGSAVTEVYASQANITSIGKFAFYESAITAIEIPQMLNVIGASAFEGTALKNITLNEGLKTIGAQAFSGCTALDGMLTIPASVTNIENKAFYNCGKISGLSFSEGTDGGSLVIDREAFRGCGEITYVEFPDRLATLSALSFYDCAKLVNVSMPADVTFAGDASSTTDNVFFNTNAIIVFDSYASYDAASRAEYVSVHAKQMTYSVNVTFIEVNENGVEINDPAEGGRRPLVEERLAGYAYNVVKTENIWSASSTGLPVQEGYASSVWYADNALTSKIDLDGVNALLAGIASSDSNKNNISVYARYVAAPVFAPVQRQYDNRDYIWSDFLTPADLNNLSSYLSVTLSGNGVTDGKARNAGTYSLSVSLKGTDYGTWSSDYSVPVIIDKKSIDIFQYLTWETTDGSTLFNARLYVYRNADGNRKYSMMELTGNKLPAGYTLESSGSITNSVTRYKNSRVDVRLRAPQENLFTVRYDNITLDGVSEAIGENNGTNEGRYVAKAMLTANSNYLFLDTAAVEDETTGMTIRISQTNQSTAVITKAWYLVEGTNKLLGTGSADYRLDGWQYNATGVTAPFAPRVENTDANTASKMTFTLVKAGWSGNIGTNVVIGNFQKYINLSMPAGTYTVTFNVPNVLAGDGTVAYFAYNESYTFTVSPAPLKDEWIADAVAKLHDIEYKYQAGANGEGVMQLYGYPDANLLAWDGKETVTFNPPRNSTNSIWSESTYNSLYSDRLYLTYNLYRMESNVYYTYEELRNNRDLFAPIKPDTYTVYYQLKANNYEPLVNEADDEARRDYKFTVTIYDVIDIPTIDSILYTGLNVTPVVAENVNYSIAYEQSYINKGTHYVTLTLRDSEHYIWNGSDEESVQVSFEITVASNSQRISLSLNQWTYGAYSDEANSPVWGTYFVDEDDENFYTFTLTSKVDGKVYTYGDETNGFGAAPVGEYTLTAYAKGYVRNDTSTDGYNWLALTVTEPFMIRKGVNTWAVTPNVMQWRFGGYDANVNLILAQASIKDENNPVKFTVYTDKDAKVAVDGLKDFTATPEGIVSAEVARVLAGLKVGAYYLGAVVAETIDYEAMNPAPFEFAVTKATNYWQKALSIESWVQGKYSAEDNKIVAVPYFGQNVHIVISDVSDETKVIYDSEKGIDNLAKAKVGVYQLRATVAGTENYDAFDGSFIFQVFEKPGLPWWAILLIVIGSLGVVALVFFILHQKGVLQMLTGKVIIAMRTKSTIDATIAAVRANKVAEEAKRNIERQKMQELSEARNRKQGELGNNTLGAQAADTKTNKQAEDVLPDEGTSDEE